MKLKKFLLVMLIIFIETIFVFNDSNGENINAKGTINNLLTTKEKYIVNISMFTANGDMVSLKKAIKDGLYDGLTVNEVKEVMVQLYAYCGFPRTLNALSYDIIF